MINNKNKFFVLAGVSALFLWVFETFLHVHIFKSGDFIEELFSLHDLNELWMRIVIMVLVLLAGSISQIMANKITKAYENEHEMTKNLKKSLKEVKLLRGILPICASCKKIRDDKGYWNQVEAYISKHSEIQFSHSICPKCAKKLYPDFIANMSDDYTSNDITIPAIE